MKGQGSGSGPVGGSDRITDLDESSLLAALGDSAQVIRQDEVDQLLLVSEWAVSHPGLGATGVLDADEHPGAEGTPAVAAFTAEPLAVALKISSRQAQSLIAETLDLKHRLPRVWDQVIALMCPVWKARRIARRTHHLPLAAMPYIDHTMNGHANTVSMRRLDHLIDTRGQGVGRAAVGRLSACVASTTSSTPRSPGSTPRHVGVKRTRTARAG